MGRLYGVFKSLLFAAPSAERRGACCARCAECEAPANPHHCTRPTTLSSRPIFFYRRNRRLKKQGCVYLITTTAAAPSAAAAATAASALGHRLLALQLRAAAAAARGLDRRALLLPHCALPLQLSYLVGHRHLLALPRLPLAPQPRRLGRHADHRVLRAGAQISDASVGDEVDQLAQMATLSCNMQRCAAGAVDGAHVGAALQQLPCHLEATWATETARRAVQRRRGVVVCRVDVGAAVQQQPRDLDAAFTRRKMQRLPANVVGSGKRRAVL